MIIELHRILLRYLQLDSVCHFETNWAFLARQNISQFKEWGNVSFCVIPLPVCREGDIANTGMDSFSDVASIANCHFLCLRGQQPLAVQIQSYPPSSYFKEMTDPNLSYQKAFAGTTFAFTEKEKSDKGRKTALPDDEQPHSDKSFYENLPFQGLKSPPKKVLLTNDPLSIDNYYNCILCLGNQSQSRWRHPWLCRCRIQRPVCWGAQGLQKTAWNKTEVITQ